MLIETPPCYWCVVCDRTGVCLAAGYFRLGDAVRYGVALVESPTWVGSVTVQPWFGTHQAEFEFWAAWWANQ